MGVYYDTYLCVGKFDNKTILVKYKVASLDQIIEDNEWERGFVYLTEVKRFFDDKYDFEEDNDQDLYFQEITSTTYGPNTMSRYLLIEKGWACKPKAF